VPDQRERPPLVSREAGRIGDMTWSTGGVEFGVKAKEMVPSQWQWIIYPKKEDGPIVRGDVIGTCEDAIAACKREFDSGLDRKNNAQRP
jgi:hypothetical protein